MNKSCNRKTAMKKMFAIMLTAIFALSLLTACSQNEFDPDASISDSKGKLGANDPSKIQVVTTIFPEYDWVREIVGLGQNGSGQSAADNKHGMQVWQEGSCGGAVHGECHRDSHGARLYQCA